MKRNRKVQFLFLGAFIVSSALGLFSDVLGGGLSSDDVDALALYVANVNNRDDLPDSLVNYNVTDPFLIDSILSGIEFNIQRDCTGIEADNSTYMYVKLTDGTRKVYHLFLIDSHIALKDRRDFCFFVSPEARSLINEYAQP